MSGKTTHKFLPQLEGLRAFAILAVIVAHWQADGNPYEYWIRWAGVFGITYFFVLSGFLIGGIVLKENELLVQKNSKTIWLLLKVFFARRALRIFPIYYLTIIILLVVGFPLFISDVFPWLFLHISNWYIFFHGWIWPTTHFWSLAVEEHFIIILPILIFFIPKKYTLYAILGMIAIGILSRITLYHTHEEFYHIITFSSFDSLGLGVLLAYFTMRYKNLPKMKWILIIALVLYWFLPLPTFYYFSGKTFLKNAIPSAALASVALVYYASKGITNKVAKLFLENKIALYIGKISYGLYIYHNLIPYFTNYLFKQFTVFPSVIITDGINASVLLIIASFSYYVIEKPIYSLKKHFKYKYDLA